MTTTPLGFQKPDGGEAVRNGDNVIAVNAQKAEDLISADRGRLTAAELLGASNSVRLAQAESMVDILALRNPANFDGGAPSTTYAPEQTIDGGTV